MTRHLATVRESYLLPPFTRASLNFFTLTFRALGRNHIASTPAGAFAMLCFYLTVGFPWSAPVLSRLLGAGRGHAPSEPPSAPTARPRRGGGPRARRSWGDPRERPRARPVSAARGGARATAQQRARRGETPRTAPPPVKSRRRPPPLPSPARAAHTVGSTRR